MKVRTRFAPAPTGMIHVGNARTALINKLFALKNGGVFILRMDDTDTQRSKTQFAEGIIEDLKWLGLDWEEIYHQSLRLPKYQEAKEILIRDGRLYECYESQEELELKRKLLLSSGRPPIYDRAGMHLTDSQKTDYRNSGRKPHYRFKIDNTLVEWMDMIKGPMFFDAANLSDPIIIKEDGSMTYMLATCVDDIDLNITHVIRGEDHVSNTAIQIQIMRALGGKAPSFGHLSLIKSEDDKISKRIGGFDIKSLREESLLEPMAINSLLANIGTKNQILPYKKLEDLLSVFDMANFGTSPTTYSQKDLETLNHKLILSMSYKDVKASLKNLGAEYVTPSFWELAQPNLKTVDDIKLWWKICYDHKKVEVNSGSIFILEATKEALEKIELSINNWPAIIRYIKDKTGVSGKALFAPLRIALTGLDYGPELSDLLCAIGKEEIRKRLIEIIGT
ncbi:MAG: glutamate--tRNA ligase [Rickettsiaceae bacterium]|nr:glutamate--tRNA ligase [Rickettsiaceae bacterium]